MKVEFDSDKSERNARLRGLSFDRAHEFDWETARYAENVRRDYPERRFVAIGWLAGRLHVICFTQIPDGVRIVSLRRANRRERRRYEQEFEAADR